MHGHSGEIISTDISKCKQIIATSSMDKTTRLYSTITGVSNLFEIYQQNINKCDLYFFPPKCKKVIF